MSQPRSFSSRRSLTTDIGWAGGNAIAPQIFQSVWAPRYLHSLHIHLALCESSWAVLAQVLTAVGVFIITALITRYMLIARNKRKVAAQAGQMGSDAAPKNLMAFEDLTDIQNPDFRYSI